MAELAGLNTLRGAFLILENIRLEQLCRPKSRSGGFFNSEKLRMGAALAGLNTFRGIFLNSAKLSKVAALAGLNTGGFFLILEKSAWQQHLQD